MSTNVERCDVAKVIFVHLILSSLLCMSTSIFTSASAAIIEKRCIVVNNSTRCGLSITGPIVKGDFIRFLAYNSASLAYICKDAIAGIKFYYSTPDSSEDAATFTYSLSQRLALREYAVAAQVRIRKFCSLSTQLQYKYLYEGKRGRIESKQRIPLSWKSDEQTIEPDDQAQRYLDSLSIDDRGPTNRVYLNSNGGSFREALLIAYFVYTSGLATAVWEKDNCHSACALIFLAGSHGGLGSHFPCRTLHSKGKLSFHAPFVGNEQAPSGRIYSAAMGDIVSLLSVLGGTSYIQAEAQRSNKWITLPFILKMLSAGSTEKYRIDTVGEVVANGFAVAGRQRLVFDKGSVAKICFNMRHLQSNLTFPESSEGSAADVVVGSRGKLIKGEFSSNRYYFLPMGNFKRNWYCAVITENECEGDCVADTYGDRVSICATEVREIPKTEKGLRKLQCETYPSQLLMSGANTKLHTLFKNRKLTIEHDLQCSP